MMGDVITHYFVVENGIKVEITKEDWDARQAARDAAGWITIYP